MPEDNSAKVTDIILVHGLFIGAWAWKYVRERLSEEFTVYTPELPFKSLETDAALVRSLVSSSVEAGRAVLLLGHSYGGMVISEAGHDATQLAFLAAMAPEPGQNCADAAAVSVSQLCNDAMMVSPDGAWTSLDDRKSIDAWYHLCSPEDTAFGVAHHRRAPSSIFTERVANPAWLSRPSTYIVCSEDLAVDPEYQRSYGVRMGSTESLYAEHSPFFSATAVLSDAIAKLARSCVA